MYYHIDIHLPQKHLQKTQLKLILFKLKIVKQVKLFLPCRIAAEWELQSASVSS